MRSIRATGLLVLCLAFGPAGASTDVAVRASVAEGVLNGEAEVIYTAEPTLVGTDPLNDFADDPDLGPLAGPLGIDITELSIRTRTAGAVEFIIKVADLQVPPPQEVFRYQWQFAVDGVEYWVQAKSSDISTVVVVDDPAGAATHLQGAFRLRGQCGPLGTLNNCKHLLWLDGAFDTERDEIRMYVPLGRAEAPHFAPGAEITPDPEGVSASIQVVVSNATTSDSALQDDLHTIRAHTYSGDFAVGPPGADPSTLDYSFGSELEVGCTFSTDVSSPVDETRCRYSVEGTVGHLPPGGHALVAKTCTPDGCRYDAAGFEV